MRNLFVPVLVLGVALAGFAVYKTKDYVGAYQNQLAVERQARANMVPTVDVFIAKRQIKYGERITDEDVVMIKWPQNALPEGVFHTPEELFPKGQIELRAALRTFEKNEPMLAVKLTQPGQEAGVTSSLAPGMRAFAVRVDVSSGVSGLIRPGDTVDVFFTANDRGGSQETRLLVPNMRVVAVDQSADQDSARAQPARTVAVEATPQQVATLAQAQQSGGLSLALVGAEDTTAAQSVTVTATEVLGNAPAAAIQKAAKVCTVKTRRGAETIVTEVDCPPEG